MIALLLGPQFVNHSPIELAKSFFHFFFLISVRWLLQGLVAFNFIQNNFVRLYVTALISLCIKQNFKIGEFLCRHYNIKDSRKDSIFRIVSFIISRKIKKQLKCMKKICAVYGKGAVTDQTCH